MVLLTAPANDWPSYDLYRLFSWQRNAGVDAYELADLRHYSMPFSNVLPDLKRDVSTYVLEQIAQTNLSSSKKRLAVLGYCKPILGLTDDDYIEWALDAVRNVAPNNNAHNASLREYRTKIDVRNWIVDRIFPSIYPELKNHSVTASFRAMPIIKHILDGNIEPIEDYFILAKFVDEGGPHTLARYSAKTKKETDFTKAENFAAITPSQLMLNYLTIKRTI